MFSNHVTSYLSDPDTNKTWSQFYDTWNDDPSHWSELSSCLKYWNNITKHRELMNHFTHFPHHGLLLCDHQDRAVILHNITIIDGHTYAFSGNKITTPPIELLQNNKLFNLVPLPDSFIDRVNPSPTIPGIITQEGPRNDDLLETESIHPSSTTESSIKPKRRGRKPTKRNESDDTNTDDDRAIDSFFILHPCALAKLLPLPKPYKLVQIKTAIDDFDQQIFNSGHYSASDLANILTGTKHILGFFQVCGSNTLHRSSLVPIDEDLLATILPPYPIATIPVTRTSETTYPSDQTVETDNRHITQTDPIVETIVDDDYSSTGLINPIPPVATATFSDVPSAPQPNRDNVLTNMLTPNDDLDSDPIPNTNHVVVLDNDHQTGPDSTSAAPTANRPENFPPPIPAHLPTGTLPASFTAHDLAAHIKGLSDITQLLLTNQAYHHRTTIEHNHLLDNVLSKNLSSPSRVRSLFDCLPPTVQTAIIRGSSSDHNDAEPTEPHPSCTDLIATANRAKAPSYLQSILRDAGVRGFYQLGQLTRLLHNGPIWFSMEKPEGLTLFAISPFPIDAESSRDKEMILSLKACHDNHLDTEDATFLAQKGYHDPTDVNELEIQLTTYTTLCSIYFGPSSLITQGLQSWVNHLQDNYPSYLSQTKDGNLFGTRVLYSIDLSIQHHLHRIKQKHIPLSDISPSYVTDEFLRLQSLVVGRQMTMNLPNEIINERSRLLNPSKRPMKPTEDPRPSKSPRPTEYRPDIDSRSRPSPTPRTTAPTNIESAVNPRVNPKWRIAPKQSFYEVFVRNKDNTPPSHNNTPFCVQFLVCGMCKRGSTCKFLHSDPRDLDMEKEFDEYCARAYSSHRS